MRKVIDSDITDFRKGNFIVTKPWSGSGKFEKAHNAKIWVYAHSGHVKNSDACYSNFERCVKIEESPACNGVCRSNKCNILQPYFCDNKGLKLTWAELGMTDLAQECDDAMRKNPALNEGIFASQGCSEASGYEYDENTWTKRLVGSLQRHLPEHEVKYTAELAMKFTTYQSTLSLLGTQHRVVQCYPFHGVCDSTINRKIQVQVDNDNSDASPSSPPQSSGDETNVECGKQADSLCRHPPKLGELTAAIYISVIQKCCRMFKKNKPIKQELKGKGIYLNKRGAPFIVELTMPIVFVEDICPEPIPSATLSVSEPLVWNLTAQALCTIGRDHKLHKCNPP